MILCLHWTVSWNYVRLLSVLDCDQDLNCHSVFWKCHLWSITPIWRLACDQNASDVAMKIMSQFCFQQNDVGSIHGFFITITGGIHWKLTILLTRLGKVLIICPCMGDMLKLVYPNRELTWSTDTSSWILLCGNLLQTTLHSLWFFLKQLNVSSD